MIVDSQMHLWRETPEFPTPEDFKKNHGANFTIEDALAQMDRSGVHRMVLVPIGNWRTGPTKNGYSLEVAQRYPDRVAVMGQFEFEAPDASAALATWKQQPGMLGIRRWLREPDLSFLTNDRYDWFWKGLVEHDIPFMSAAAGHMTLYGDILRRYPGLRLVIDHAGRVPWGLDDQQVWEDLPDTLALARYPRVTVKVSSLPCFSSKPYPFPSLHEPIRRIYDAFGPRRMLWGSDISRLKWDYDDNIRLFTEALDFLSAEDRGWIMGRAANEALGWPQAERLAQS